MDEPRGMFNVRQAIPLLCVVSTAAAIMAPATSFAACALPGCHGQSRSSTAAKQASVIYGEPAGNTLAGNAGTYRKSGSDTSELRTFAMAAAGA
ncbi:hypothetical protein ACFW03_28920, partial [Peribacillus butanolivorans]